MLPFTKGWSYWLRHPEVSWRCHHAENRCPGADAARHECSGRSHVCGMESPGSASLWMTRCFLHCPGGNLATPHSRLFIHILSQMEIFFSKAAPSVFPLFNHPGKNLTVVSAELILTSAHRFQSSSCSDSKTRALDMWLSCPDFFLLSGDIFFFLHLHLANKNLPDVSLRICQIGQSSRLLFFFLILFTSFCWVSWF